MYSSIVHALAEFVMGKKECLIPAKVLIRFTRNRMVTEHLCHFYLYRQGFAQKGEKNVCLQMLQQGSVSLDLSIIFMYTIFQVCNVFNSKFKSLHFFLVISFVIKAFLH